MFLSFIVKYYHSIVNRNVFQEVQKLGAYKLTACGSFPPDFTKPLGKVTACGPVEKISKKHHFECGICFYHFSTKYFYAAVLILFFILSFNRYDFCNLFLFCK